MGAEQSTENSASTEIPVIQMAQDLPQEDGGGQTVESNTIIDAQDEMAQQTASSSFGTDADSSQMGGAAIRQDLPDYRMQKNVVLGEGAFGKVRLASSSRTGHKVAVKVIKRKKLNDRNELLLHREVKHHEKLRHPNIVRLHTFIMTPNKYYLVMEYCRGGDLLHYINESPLISEERARNLFRGVMEGIRFCHVLGIHHRDLKLENIMLTSQQEPMRAKIADFGLSDLQTAPGGLSGTFCGSPLYAAPELMTTGAAPEGYDASKSDIWSCGVILYALLSSALPFDADDIGALVRLIQLGVPTAPVHDSRSEHAKELVYRLLTINPKARPSAGDVLQHSWLKSEVKAIKSSVTTLELPAVQMVSKRRGASATTNFYKTMLAQMRHGEQADAPEASDSSIAFLAPFAAEGGDRDFSMNATCSSPSGTLAPGMQHVAIVEEEPVSADKQVGASMGQDSDQIAQQQGESHQSGAAHEMQENSAGPPARRQGDALTKEEWEEIRQERQRQRELRAASKSANS